MLRAITLAMVLLASLAVSPLVQAQQNPAGRGIDIPTGWTSPSELSPCELVVSLATVPNLFVDWGMRQLDIRSNSVQGRWLDDNAWAIMYPTILLLDQQRDWLYDPWQVEQVVQGMVAYAITNRGPIQLSEVEQQATQNVVTRCLQNPQAL
jgi:hypothetical protein